MSVTFNHTIIASEDRQASARFYCDLFEVSEAESWGPFTNVALDGGVLLQFAEPGETNTEHGGRGVYFRDPSGHGLEMITRPYL